MSISSSTKQSIVTALFSAVFVLAFLFLTNYFLNHSWNLFGSSSKQLFTVDGTSSLSQKPDQAEVSFTVSKTATALLDAQNQANTLTNKIVADLEKIGIPEKDIKTSNYSSNPNYDNGNVRTLQMMPPQGNGQTITGYTVSENVVVTLTDIAKANSVIDVATKDGAQNIYGPNLTFSQSTQQQLIQKARIAAIQDAKQKAQSLADAAGIRLGRIVNIQESGTPLPIQPMMLKAGSGVANGAPTQINPGVNTITETVTLSYETW